MKLLLFISSITFLWNQVIEIEGQPTGRKFENPLVGNLDPENFEDAVDHLVAGNTIPPDFFENASVPSPSPSNSAEMANRIEASPNDDGAEESMASSFEPKTPTPTPRLSPSISLPSMNSPQTHSPTQSETSTKESSKTMSPIFLPNTQSSPPTATNINKAENLPEGAGKKLAQILEDNDGIGLSEIIAAFIGTYVPDNPRDIDTNCGWRKQDCSIMTPNYWVANVVTPVPTGVNGSLVQAALFTNEHRNPDNPKRILSFAGVNLFDNFRKTEQLGVCLAAAYQYKGTEAENSWLYDCFKAGFIEPDIEGWAAQIDALVEEYQPTLLTGHMLGCEFAKIQGILTGLPVVCFLADPKLNQAWIDGYPGLATAMATKPKNDNIFVIQTYTSPNANCLLPAPKPEESIANLCVYGARKRCDPTMNYTSLQGTIDVAFDYSLVNGCSSLVEGYLSLISLDLYNMDFSTACYAKEDIGYDQSWRQCPYEDYVAPTTAPTDFSSWETTPTSGASTISKMFVVFATATVLGLL